MKIQSRPNLASTIIIALLLGMYILYILHYTGVLHFKKSDADPKVSKSKKTKANLKGPYEACEDQICTDISTKKSCMCANGDKIKMCCEQSCGGNPYCMEACEPMFDPCM